MASIDQTIVATALPAIDRSLGSTVNWASWTISIYAVGRVVGLPVTGRMCVRYGERSVFVTSILLFGLSSGLCAASQNIAWLITLRFCQALGGSAFQPCATGLVARYFGTGRDRAVALFTTVIPIGAIVGPIIGGAIVSFASWRWIFLVNLPLCAVLLVLSMLFIPNPPIVETRDQGKIDYFGIACLSGGLVITMAGVSALGSSLSLLTVLVVVAAEVVGIALLRIFVRHVRRVPNPVIAPALLRGKGFGVMNTVNVLYGATALGFAALAPLYAERRFEVGPVAAGGLLSVRAIGMVLLSTVTAFVMRRLGHRIPLALGMIICGAGLFGLAITPVGDTALYWLWGWSALVGVGVGAAAPASNNAMMHLWPERASEISSLRGTFRQGGSVIGVSLTTSILAGSSNPGLAQAVVFVIFAATLIGTVPLLWLVPDHRGSW